MTANNSKIKDEREGTGLQADWKHVGAQVPPELFGKLVAAARKDSVPQSAVIRWALADYFASTEGGTL
jgi:hypothetical protein